jgi:hypothetical protein
MWSPSTDDCVVPNPEAPGPLPRGLRHRGGPCAAPSSTCGSQTSHPNPPDRTRGLSSWCTPATNGPMTAGCATWYGGRVRVRDHDDPGPRQSRHDHRARGRDRQGPVVLGAEKGRTGRTQAGASRPGLGDPMVGRPTWPGRPRVRRGSARSILPAGSSIARAARAAGRARRPERRSLRPPWIVAGLASRGVTGGGGWRPAPASSPGRSRGALQGR